ncbi:hypothetical protein [Thalassotalea sp. PLHSN55]|uniref:hypothetical protein n=1 Tax=Thalassotalea sp. PLHSN55 TaxID=3435888 RepID=UPI003F841B20
MNNNFIGFFIFLLLSFNGQANEVIDIPITQTLLSEYHAYQQEFKVKKEQAFLKRTVADLLIFQQALIAGGITAKLNYLIVPNLKREFLLLKHGEIVASPRIISEGSVSDDVKLSTAIIKKGNFKKLMYGLKSNQKLMSANNLDDLKELRAVLASGWKYDKEKLTQLGFKHIITTYNYPTIFKLIKHRDIDFTLLDLPSRENMLKYYQGIELAPVPNIIITLPNSRHFMISRNHADSEKVSQALTKGIRILHENGTIKKYYQQAKMYHPRFEQWQEF